MFANLSPNNPLNLNKTSICYNAVVDLLSQFNIGANLTEDYFNGINQNISSIRGSLSHLEQNGFLTKLQLAFCEDCGSLSDEELICQECGKNAVLSSLAAKENIYRVLKSIDRSADSQWVNDRTFFNTKIFGLYSGGSKQVFWACIRSGEILLPVSANMKNTFPNVFKLNDDIFQINSDEIFYPLFGNRVRHYHYSVTYKENKIVQNNKFINNGNIGNLNQNNQINYTQTSSVIEVVALLDLILKNLDQTAANYSQHKEQINDAKIAKGFLEKLNATLSFLSSAVTVAGFDLAGTIDQIKKIIQF